MSFQGSSRSGPLPPRFKDLMQGCRQMARTHLVPLFASVLDNADVALLEFASKAESNAAQAQFFAAMQEFKRKRGDLEQTFFKTVDAGFRDFIKGATDGDGAAPAAGPTLGGLSLVDKGEVEESLPLQNMTAKAHATYSEVLYGLTQRLAVVNGGGRLQDEHLPGGPSQIARAARDAFHLLDMDGKTRMVAYAVFDRSVMRELRGLYEEYNRRLVNAGILRNLKYEIRKQPDPRPVQRGAGDGAGASASARGGGIGPAGRASAEVAGGAAGRTVGEETFETLRELLAKHRTAGGGEAAVPPPTEAVAASSRTTILGAIDSIQQAHGDAEAARRFNAEVIETVAVDQALLEKLKIALVDERQQLYGGVDRRRVASADADVIDLVGMLFDYMLQDEQLPNAVKALLSRLHTPYLKVAILDRHLFTDIQHPARRLLDVMAAAGARWVSEDDLDRGIFPCMRHVVERILAEFKDDLSLFGLLGEEFAAHLREVEQKAEVIEKRSVETADGQARLQHARVRAQEEIAARLRRSQLRPEAQDFLREVWTEKLTFILLREKAGEDSEPWRLALTLADDIVFSLDRRGGDAARAELRAALPALRARLQQGLDDLRAYGRRDNDRLLAQISQWQDERLARTETPPQPQPDTAPVPREMRPPQAPARPPSPALEATLEQLGSLAFGTWFEFKEAGGVRAHRRKLAWFSKISSNYMFVDAMGVKAAEYPRMELARLLCAGQARILTLEHKPLLDRALESILAWLGRDKAQAAS